MTKLSHIDKANQPTMVDVSHKVATDREAHARTIVEFPGEVAERFSVAIFRAPRPRICDCNRGRCNGCETHA